MFTGNNEIVLNEATVLAALEHWLNSRVMATGSQVLVKSVKFKDDAYSKSIAVSVEPKVTLVE